MIHLHFPCVLGVLYQKSYFHLTYLLSKTMNIYTQNSDAALSIASNRLVSTLCFKSCDASILYHTDRV